MVNSDYSIYQKSTAWISRFSFRARGNTMTKNPQDCDQASVVSAPGIYSSPESSGFTSTGAMDSDVCSNLISPSPSTSTSSWTSNLTTRKAHLLMDNQQESSLPPSPTLTAYDKRTSTIDCSYSLPPVDTASYFTNRPLPTQRRQPGRHRHSTIESSKSLSSALCDTDEPDRHSLVLEKLAYDTLTYFVDSPSPSSSSPLLESSTHDNHPTNSDKLVGKLTSRLTASSSVHPSVLKLAQDVLAFMNETPPMAIECQQLKPKLEVCLLVHGKDLP